MPKLFKVSVRLFIHAAIDAEVRRIDGTIVAENASQVMFQVIDFVAHLSGSSIYPEDIQSVTISEMPTGLHVRRYRNEK